MIDTNDKLKRIKELENMDYESFDHLVECEKEIRKLKGIEEQDHFHFDYKRYKPLSEKRRKEFRKKLSHLKNIETFTSVKIRYLQEYRDLIKEYSQ